MEDIKKKDEAYMRRALIEAQAAFDEDEIPVGAIKEHQVDKELRFDIISVVGVGHQVKCLEHLKDAFNPMLIL